MASYTTPRKRAENLGSAGDGTHHFWHMILSSVALIVLVPLFVFTLGFILGGTYDEVRVALANPFVAVVIGLTLLVGLVHFRNGAQVVLEDYAHGLPRQIMVIAMVCVTYAILAIGLLAVVRLAL